MTIVLMTMVYVDINNGENLQTSLVYVDFNNDKSKQAKLV